MLNQYNAEQKAAAEKKAAKEKETMAEPSTVTTFSTRGMPVLMYLAMTARVVHTSPPTPAP